MSYIRLSVCLCLSVCRWRVCGTDCYILGFACIALWTCFGRVPRASFWTRVARHMRDAGARGERRDRRAIARVFRVLLFHTPHGVCACARWWGLGGGGAHSTLTYTPQTLIEPSFASVRRAFSLSVGVGAGGHGELLPSGAVAANRAREVGWQRREWVRDGRDSAQVGRAREVAAVEGGLASHDVDVMIALPHEVQGVADVRVFGPRSRVLESRRPLDVGNPSGRRRGGGSRVG
eukprot:scaffold52508_cov52-Phaeocystis_antarctica.AAC.1